MIWGFFALLFLSEKYGTCSYIKESTSFLGIEYNIRLSLTHITKLASARDFGTYRMCAIINDHADVAGKARDLNFCMSLYLHPYFVFASSEGFGESVPMGRLAQTFAVSR